MRFWGLASPIAQKKPKGIRLERFFKLIPFVCDFELQGMRLRFISAGSF